MLFLWPTGEEDSEKLPIYVVYDTNYIMSIIILDRAQPLANSKTCASFFAILET